MALQGRLGARARAGAERGDRGDESHMAGGRGPALGHFGGTLVQAPRPCFSGWAQSTRGGVHPGADTTQPANRPGQPTRPRRGSRAGHRRAMPSLCRAARGDHLLGAARAVALLALDVDVPRLPARQPRVCQGPRRQRRTG